MTAYQMPPDTHSSSHWFRADSIGSLARQALSENQEASVMGRTSRGVFIKTAGKWLVFLSSEPFQGPLTITFKEIGALLEAIFPEAVLEIISGKLIFLDSNVAVSTRNSPVWKPPPTPSPALSKFARRKNLTSLTRVVMRAKSGIGLSPLLSYLFDPTEVPPLLVPGLRPDPEEILRIQESVRDCDAARLSGLLSNILGSGAGLTPSSDDFVIGLLLSLNRWSKALWLKGSIDELNFPIVETAYQKTTTLSANLIECAALGLADERLTNTLDYLMSGVARDPGFVDHLLDWGSSSGVDAFVGMATASACFPADGSMRTIAAR